MPGPQLAISAIEVAVNRVLHLDPATAVRLSHLAGKQLAVDVKELGMTVVLAFSDRIDLLLPEINKNDRDNWDCKITLSLWSIKELQDPSRITQLIKQDRLDVQGDIQIAQDFSSLIKGMDIDWEEHLSRYTGDVIAHQVIKTGKKVHETALSQLQKFARVISEGAIEEKKIAAPAIAVTHFADQVHQVRADVERLQSRVDIISANIKD